MKEKILKFIKSNFKENDIFSASEIKLNGVDQLTISKTLSSLVLSKDIYRLSYGFYCLSIPDEDSLIKGLYKRYIIDDKKVFGVFGGDNYLNNLLGKKLDLNNLVIYSNKVTSGKKSIYIFYRSSINVWLIQMIRLKNNRCCSWLLLLHWVLSCIMYAFGTEKVKKCMP